MAGNKQGGELKWSNNFSAWVAACTEKHDGKYSYGRSFEREPNGVRWKVPIECPIHGEFMQAPEKHKGGQGCPVCSGNEMVAPLEQMRAAFPEQVFPDDWNFKSKEIFTLVCDTHGPFETHFNQMMGTKALGSGIACPKCSIAARGKKIRVDEEELLRRLNEASPEYSFLVTENTTTQGQVDYLCPDHGEKSGKVSDLLRGIKCPECAALNRRAGIIEVRGVSQVQNVLDVFAAHEGRVIPHLATIKGTHEFSTFTCVKHGTFKTMLYAVKAGKGCPRCSHRISKAEIEINKWIKEQGIDTVIQCKETLEQGEVDIMIPSHSVAIEFCGTYWHSEEKAGRGKHLRKLKDAGQAGVRLLTIFEDEWTYKKDIAKRAIQSILGIAPEKIGARSTTMAKVDWAEVAPVYDEFHLQGAGSPCGENYGLYHAGQLVAAMSFKVDRFGDRDFELVRYVSKVRVVGGFSKLVGAFRKNHAAGTTLVSYCDLRWFMGDSYEAAGFHYAGASSPGYWWCKGRHRYSRMMFQKHKLKGKLANFDPDKTEDENMKAHGFWKIWDCGMSKWEMTL